MCEGDHALIFIIIKKQAPSCMVIFLLFSLSLIDVVAPLDVPSSACAAFLIR